MKRAGALLTRFVHHGAGRVTRQSRHSFVYGSDKPLSTTLTLNTRKITIQYLVPMEPNMVIFRRSLRSRLVLLVLIVFRR